jgi:hypothetical protein
MISIWILIGFFIVFTVVLVWERWDYKQLYIYTEVLETYLDKYISTYGPKFGITIGNTREDIDADTK